MKVLNISETLVDAKQQSRNHPDTFYYPEEEVVDSLLYELNNAFNDKSKDHEIDAPAGCGKTTRSIPLIKKGMKKGRKYIMILTTYKNIEEVDGLFEEEGV